MYEPYQKSISYDVSKQQARHQQCKVLVEAVHPLKLNYLKSFQAVTIFVT